MEAIRKTKGKLTTEEHEAKNLEELSNGPLIIFTESIKNNTQVLINCHNNRRLLDKVRYFDRHLNMVLVWTTSKPVHRDRFLGKMFLRGYSVIKTIKKDTSHIDTDNKKPVALPFLVKNCKEVGEETMPEAADITKRIEGTLLELHKTKRNVPINGRWNISEPEDVLEEYEESCDSPGVMGARLQLQAMGAPTIKDISSQLTRYCPRVWRVNNK